MSLSWLRGNRGPLLRWGLFMLALAGVGWALHARLPPVPRWVLYGSFIPEGLTLDGKLFITQTVAVEDRPNSNRSPSFPSALPKGGPVRFWDVETGQEVNSVLGETGPRGASSLPRTARAWPRSAPISRRDRGGNSLR